MARLEIIVRARSPLSLGTMKAYTGTLIETGDYVAGGQLRGALGAMRNFVSSSEQAEIDQLLGTPGQVGIQFPNCYLSGDRPAYPLPFTAQSCKRKSGFVGIDKKEKDHHGVADTLLMQLAYDRIAGADGQWHIPLPFQYKCPKCGHRTELFTGVVESRGPRDYTKPEVSSHRQTRVAINRARLTAEESQLYTVQAIDEGSLFVGVIDVDDARIQLARKWLPKITRIGGRTSRGFGRVAVEVKDARWSESLWNRLESFNQKHREFEADLRAIAHEPPAPETRTLFTINLRSDALLRTREGLPTLRFDATLLRDALDGLLTEDERSRYSLDSFNFKLIAEYTQPQTVSGWQTAWQLPKEVLLASRRGGLYVFAAETGGDENRQGNLIALLEKLEAAGIGEMREDGYGQIVVCDPFHLEVNPV
jgi:CRISPR-associated protein Csx10